MSTPDRDTITVAASLLSRWWSRPVVGQIEEWGEFADVAAEVSTALAGVGVPIYDVSDGELLREYDRLFVGPGPVPCPPYESYWRTDVPLNIYHSLMGPCVPQLTALYDSLGFGVDPATYELPDHVAIEFEALGYALSHPGVGVAGEVATPDAVSQALLTKHLDVWLPKFCQAVEAESRLPYYAELARVTVDWLGRIRPNV